MLRKMRNWLERVYLWLVATFTRLRREIKENIRPSIVVVEAIKFAVDHQAADVLVALTKTGLDNAALVWVRRFLAQALAAMRITEKCITANATDTEIIRCVVAEIRNLSPDLRDAVYARLASRLSGLAAEHNGQLGSDREAKVQLQGHRRDALTQLEYSNLKATGKLQDIQNQIAR